MPPTLPGKEALIYTLSLFKPVLGIDFFPLDVANEHALVFDTNTEQGYMYSAQYWQEFQNGNFQTCHQIFTFFKKDKFWLEKIFHLINCVQEYNSAARDQFGRYRYDQSWQFKENTIDKNVVLSIMQHFVTTQCRVSSFNIKRTQLFLSHDIDTIHGELMQNGLYYLKTRKFNQLRTVILNYLMRKPGWANMDLINKIHDEHGLKHAYFWLVTKAKANQIKNADYSIGEVKKYIHSDRCHGLHKSSTSMSFRQELEKLPVSSSFNRNHFLRFELPNHWQLLDDAGIAIDASVGFAEHYGFRNSYGYIFRPFNMQSGKAHRHLSVPLHMMDATFRNYMSIPTDQTAEVVIQFIENNREGCVLSLLWHNTFFSDGKYEGYLNQYLKILAYIKESNLETLDFADLLQLESNT